MEEIDRKKRQEAGRTALLDRGTTEEDTIRSILQSPKRENERTANATPAAAAADPRQNSPLQLVAAAGPRQLPRAAAVNFRQALIPLRQGNFRGAAAADERGEARYVPLPTPAAADTRCFAPPPHQPDNFRAAADERYQGQDVAARIRATIGEWRRLVGRRSEREVAGDPIAIVAPELKIVGMFAAVGVIIMAVAAKLLFQP
jgi:hypothetical protein